MIQISRTSRPRRSASTHLLPVIALLALPVLPAFACGPGYLKGTVSTTDPVTGEVYTTTTCVYVGFGSGSSGSFSGSGSSRSTYSNSMSLSFEDGGFQRAGSAIDAVVDCFSAGNPVSIRNGNKIEQEVDFVTGGDEPLFLARTYNHFWPGIGLFGKNWLSNFDYRLTFGTVAVDACYPRPGGGACGIGSNTIIYAWRPDGRTIRYVKNVNDGVFYEDKPGPVSRIVKQADGTFLLYGEDNERQLYTTAGHVISAKNEHGVGWTMSYSGLYPTRATHTSGRYVEFTWTGSQLTAARDPAGNHHRYGYDASLRLATTTRPGAPTTTITYHYEDVNNPAALTGKSFNGVRYSTFSYFPTGMNKGKGASTEHGGQDKFTFAYIPGLLGDGTPKTDVTNPLGKKTTYEFNGSKLAAVIGHPSTNCPLATAALSEYDANGYPAMKSDANGNETAFTYNAKGQLTQMVEAYGTPQARTSQFTWDTVANRMLTATQVGVLKTTYTYHPDNRLASISQTNLLAPSPANNLNQVRTTNFSYTTHSSGILASETIDGPIPGTGDAQVTTYDTLGNKTSITTAGNRVTTYANYNALGLPGRVTTPNGAIIEYVYDERGRTTAVRKFVNGAWHTTSFYYDARDAVTAVRQADGHWEVKLYDAVGRLSAKYQPEAGGTYAQLRYTYNNDSAVTRIDTERLSGVSLAGPPSTSLSSITTPATNATGSYTTSWSAVSGATRYQFEESLAGGPWTVVQNTSATSRAFSGKGTGSYAYRVAACQATGCGGYSAVASTAVSIPAPTSAPTFTLPIDPYEIDGVYTVGWTSVSGATRYELEENKDGGAWSLVYSGTALSLQRSKTNGSYGYRIRACNANGCSVYSPTRIVQVEIEHCPTC